MEKMTQAVKRFENVELCLDEPVVYEHERSVIRAVLQKLATCAQSAAKIGDLYELQTRTRLNVSCEMVGFNWKGEVYLVQRPSLEEKPDEPYPLKWHTLGVGIEPYEQGRVVQWEDVFVSVARKFGKDVVLVDIEHVPPIVGMGHPYIVHDLPRGPYLLQIFAAHIHGKPDNPRGKWFTREEAIGLDLVESHREKILPTAFMWYDAVGFGDWTQCERRGEE